MTNVKDICPLFRQKDVTIENKVKNLKLLMDSQTVGINANVTMDDLESAIMQDSASIDATTNNAEEVEVSSPSPPPAIEQSEVDKEADCATAD